MNSVAALAMQEKKSTGVELSLKPEQATLDEVP